MKRLLNILLFLLLFTLAGCYSCKSYHEYKGTGPVPSEVAHKFYWDKECKPIARAAPRPAPKPAPVKPKPAPVSGCGPSAVSRSYPCEGCEIIQLNKAMPREVQLNAPFDYTIKVTNVTDMTVADIVVTETTSKNFKFNKASPAAKQVGNKLSWAIGSLGPKESEVITVSGMAANTDCLKHCATVAYVVPACANVKVVEPELKLVKTAPEEVLICDPIPVKFVVTNSGTGAAENVKIVDTLPAGLKTSDGRSELAFNAGTLGAGESKKFSATLKASKTGEYVNKAFANSAGGLKAQSETTTVVRQPVLVITKSGPELRYLGRSVTYEITISNKGDAAAEDVVVVDTLPTGVSSVVPSNEGSLAAGKVTWKLGTLSPNKSRKVSVMMMPGKAGVITNAASVTATCAESVRDSAKTSVVGIPAVLLEVIDIDDPVEVGGRTTYLITTTNQGTAVDTNISIVCTLEGNHQYVSSSGATTASAVGNKVTFAPLRSLAPKAKVTWRVVVKAAKAGDVRFKVTMNTDQLTRPVEETESTNFYE